MMLKSPKFVMGMLVISMLASSMVVQGDGTRAEWAIESVGIDMVEYSFALGPGGSPHAAFAGSGPQGEYALYYAFRSGGSWITQAVDTESYGGSNNAIAIDGGGKPHISYMAPALGLVNHLYYATKTGSEWSVQLVDDSVGVGYDTSIAVSAGGTPHISYWNPSNGDLKYATNSGGAWSVQVVDSGGSVGSMSSITLDSSGTPHISYRDITNADLKYAKKVGGAWSLQTVDSAGDVGTWTSLTLDSLDNPHIAYIAAVGNLDNDVKYARWTGTSWDIRTLDAEDICYSTTSIDIATIDTVDNVFVTYTADYDKSDPLSWKSHIRVQRWDGSSWSKQTIGPNAAGESMGQAYMSVYNDQTVNVFYNSALLSGDEWVMDMKLATQQIFPTSKPGAPTNLVASPGDSMVSLSWAAPSDDGGAPITDYNLYRGDSQDALEYIASTGTLTSSTDTGLTNGNTYYYAVTANNSKGEGPKSSVASSTPDSGASGNMYVGTEEVTFSISVGEEKGFDLQGEVHSIELSSVSNTGATVIISSTPQTLDLSLGAVQYLDLDSDNIDDLAVTLKSVDAAAQTATISLESLEEEASGGTPGFGIPLILLSLLISFALFGAFRKRRGEQN